jgi:uncharacterized membrane protein YkoI
MRISISPIWSNYRLLAMAVFSTRSGDGPLSVVVSGLSSVRCHWELMGVANCMRSVIGAIVMAIAVAATAFADDDHEGRHESAERASRGARTGEFVPLARIIAGVRERYVGDIVETELEAEDGQYYYEFHILQQNGRLIEIKVDARSGRYLKSRTDDD